MRRTFLKDLGRAGLALALGSMTAAVSAQRPAHPIARPRPPRPDRPVAPGRFYPVESGGTAGAAPLPGVFTVVAVDTRGGSVQLRDEGGRSGSVQVDPELFDLETLSSGDQVEVDFVIPEAGSTKLQAAGIWKLEPARR